jgi:hypothetical protein
MPEGKRDEFHTLYRSAFYVFRHFGQLPVSGGTGDPHGTSWPILIAVLLAGLLFELVTTEAGIEVSSNPC